MLGPSAVGILGRNEAENGRLEDLASGRPILRPADRPGPSAVLLGEGSALPLLAGLVAFYARSEPGAIARIEAGPGPCIEVEPATREIADALLVRLPEPGDT